MSDNFPNAVYIPTGLAGDNDFIKISGYCYRRVDSGTVSAGQQMTNFVTGFDDCLDCNTCNCPKTINFIFGGIVHNISDNTFGFGEKLIPITTSSTGWQEIAIQSGFLDDGDPNINFKPTNIRCYDRKIDIQSGIFVSFDSASSHIAHFNYVSGQDLYERQDLSDALSTGKFGTVPAWDYFTQYDSAVTYQNTVKTIRFKSLCEVPCSQYDINFRLRGKVSESFPKYFDGSSPQDSSWMYLNCTGVPRTPGQIVRYNFGSGLSVQKYFLPDKSEDDATQPTLKFAPEDLELVNLDVLTGNSSDRYVQLYSVTGGGHYYNAGKQQGRGNSSYYYDNTDFYDFDFDDIGGGYLDGSGSDEYMREVGSFGLDYNKTPHCLETGVQEFKKQYGIEGRSGCFQASEFIDGIYKAGTFRPMMFTGTISGNNADYAEVYENGVTVGAWSSGVYVFQVFPSGDDSQLSKISGYAGNIDELSSESLIDEYKKRIANSLPINIDNPIRRWNFRSGNFIMNEASLVYGAAFLEFSSQEMYDMWYQTSTKHDAGGEEIRFVPFASGFRFNSGSFDLYYGNEYIGGGIANPPILDMSNHTPISLQHTLVDYSRISERHIMLDSGNSLHNESVYPNGLVDAQSADPPSTQIQSISAITFQIPFDT